MRKNIIYTLITIFISLTLLVVGGEIITRVFFEKFYVIDEMNLTYRYDERYGWFPIENSTKEFKGTRLIHVQHNKNGFRDINHGAKNKKRIAFLGDSFVWGYDVEYGERFTEYLQESMPGWEIINMGVSGFSNDQELLLIKDWFDEIKPDIVFLVVCDNDFEGNCSNVMHRYYKPFFTQDDEELILKGVPVSKSLPYYTIKYPRLMKSRLAQFTVQLTLDDKILVENPTSLLVREMKSFVQSKGADFFIALTNDSGEQKTCVFCEENEIPFVFLTNDYRYDRNGYHWTPQGNKFVSNRIYDFLKMQNVISEDLTLE